MNNRGEIWKISDIYNGENIDDIWINDYDDISKILMEIINIK